MKSYDDIAACAAMYAVARAQLVEDSEALDHFEARAPGESRAGGVHDRLPLFTPLLRSRSSLHSIGSFWRSLAA